MKIFNVLWVVLGLVTMTVAFTLGLKWGLEVVEMYMVGMLMVLGLTMLALPIPRKVVARGGKN